MESTLNQNHQNQNNRTKWNRSFDAVLTGGQTHNNNNNNNKLMGYSILTYYPNTKLKNCKFISLLFYNMFQLFYSAIIRQKHKYITENVCYGRGISFTISMIKYIQFSSTAYFSKYVLVSAWWWPNKTAETCCKKVDTWSYCFQKLCSSG